MLNALDPGGATKLRENVGESLRSGSEVRHTTRPGHHAIARSLEEPTRLGLGHAQTKGPTAAIPLYQNTAIELDPNFALFLDAEPGKTNIGNLQEIRVG